MTVQTTHRAAEQPQRVSLPEASLPSAAQMSLRALPDPRPLRLDQSEVDAAHDALPRWPRVFPSL